MEFQIDPEFRDILPPLTTDEFTRLCTKIELEGTEGYILTLANINGERFLMDGHNSLKACESIGCKPPPTREIKLASRDLVLEWIVNNQLARRNLTDEARAYFMGKKYTNEKKNPGRQASNDKVLDSSTYWTDVQSEDKVLESSTLSGKTAERIAEEQNVSPATVRANATFAAAVDAIAEQEGPEAKAEILNGTSGETKQGVISRARNPILCERCQRVGAVKNCTVCKDLRAANKAEKANTKPATEKKSEEKPEDPESIPQDDFKTPLPKGKCRDAFCDPWIQKTFDLLSSVSEKILKARIADGMRKRSKAYPFFNEKDFCDGMGFVIQYIDDVMEHIKDNRPAGVCPLCKGEGCPACMMSGLVPRDLYNSLKLKESADADTTSVSDGSGGDDTAS